MRERQIVCVGLRERDRAILQNGVGGSSVWKRPSRVTPGFAIHHSLKAGQETAERTSSIIQSQALLFPHHRSHLFLSTIHSMHARCTQWDLTPGCHLEYVYSFLFYSAWAMMTQINHYHSSPDRDGEIALPMLLCKRTNILLVLDLNYE